MTRPPIWLFSWRRAFLPDLKNALEAHGTNRPGSALIIVPHNRPRRYLTQLYRQQKKAALLPKVITLDEMTGMLRAASGNTPLASAAILDRVALLYQCVQELTHEGQMSGSPFARMDTARFLPWGVRLANLLEEMFRHGLEGADLAHVESDTAEPAAVLLGALGRIRRAYMAALAARDLSTPGLEYYYAAQSLDSLAPLLQPSADRPVYMAGFYLLTGTEDVLLRKLWQAGARMCLHTDLDSASDIAHNFANNTAIHRACAEHTALVRRWGATTVPAPIEVLSKGSLASPTQSPDALPRRPEFFFFAGYDCHSQLQEVHEVLARDAAHGDSDHSPSTAVVLTDNTLLMPVLHHLPNKDVNISMGYPLERSPLNRLLDALMRLRDNASEEGLPHRRDVLKCLRHPYLNMLRVTDADGNELFLREALRRLEDIIRQGSRFTDFAAASAQCKMDLAEPLACLLDQCLHTAFIAFGKAETTAEAAQCLSQLCSLLIEYGGEMWQHFPLDAEAMYRLMQHVAPALRDCIWAETPFPPAMLHALIRQVLASERVPFEADPLTGVQVLGMLETRLLHFERVLLVDAVDDILPGNSPQDPLLPDALRQALGLPDARGRERAAAHTLYRLCAGASEVHFFWQEGINRSSLFDGKKSRSRFVEQLIWQEEQARSALLVPGQGPLRTASCAVQVHSAKPQSLRKSPALDAALQKVLDAPLSATRLDAYLQCPLLFARRHLCRLSPADDLNEGDDPIAVGLCIHDTLRAMYTPWLHKEVHRGDISATTMRACFYEALEATNLRRDLPPDSLMMLETAVPMRLERFLASQPERTLILALEHKLSIPLFCNGREYTFTGTLDRLDKRDGLLHVLDYKTGRIMRGDGSLWGDTAFFARVSDILPDDCTNSNFIDTNQDIASQTHMNGNDLDFDRVDLLFNEVRERLPSLQLPCYLSMLRRAGLGQIGDAALVELRDAGAEVRLFGGLDGEDIAAALNHCDSTLALVLRHMEHTPVFTALPGPRCTYCHYKNLCRS